MCYRSSCHHYLHPVKSRMETFRYWLTQVHVKAERVRERFVKDALKEFKALSLRFNGHFPGEPGLAKEFKALVEIYKQTALTCGIADYFILTVVDAMRLTFSMCVNTPDLVVVRAGVISC